MNIYTFYLMLNPFHLLVSIKSKKKIDINLGVVDSKAKESIWMPKLISISY